MKKTLTFIVLFVLTSAFLFIGCSKLRKDRDSSTNDDPALIIGHFLKDGSGIPELGLTFDEAVSLVRELNTHVEPGLLYDYTEVWIETLNNLDGTTDYYFSSRADVTNVDGEKVYNCYSHFILLVEDENGGLILAPPGGSGSSAITCTGHCCKTCVIKKAEAGQTSPSCECDAANTVDDCSGKTGYCDQTTTWE